MNQMMLIRNELEENLGKKVIIKADKGRKKYVVRKGILKSVHPMLFAIDVVTETGNSTFTYTYSDILTNTVKLTILDDGVKYVDVKKIS